MIIRHPDGNQEATGSWEQRAFQEEHSDQLCPVLLRESSAILPGFSDTGLTSIAYKTDVRTTVRLHALTGDIITDRNSTERRDGLKNKRQVSEPEYWTKWKQKISARKTLGFQMGGMETAKPAAGLYPEQVVKVSTQSQHRATGMGYGGSSSNSSMF